MLNTRLVSFALALTLAAAGCGSQGGADLNPGKPVRVRIYRGVDGQLHDKDLADEVCTYRPMAGSCELRCFPPEGLYPACGNDGLLYFYTRQGLTRDFHFGAVRTLFDPNCQGDTTYELVALARARPDHAFVCGSPSLSLDLNFSDRIWYSTRDTPIEPATLAEAGSLYDPRNPSALLGTRSTTNP